MRSTHLDLEHALDRNRRRLAEMARRAQAFHDAFEAAMQRQCGAGPGHIWVKADPQSERTARCAVCGADRRLVTGDLPNQPPREQTWASSTF